MKMNRPAPFSLHPEAFRLGKRGVHPDHRGRLTLGKLVQDTEYEVLINDAGQLLLNPVVTVTAPASEAWLWDNPALRGSMGRALQQAAKSEFHDLGSFAGYADAEGKDKGEE